MNTMNPALSQEFHIFREQEQLQKHATLDKNAYCVYGTLNVKNIHTQRNIKGKTTKRKIKQQNKTTEQ